MSEKIKTAVMEIIKAHMDGEDKNTKAVLSDVMESVREILEQEPCDECRNKRTSFCGNCNEYDEFEPCVDAVSRDAVIDLIKRCYPTEEQTTGCLMIESINKLPSVTQKSETVTEFADRCRECGKRYVKRQTGHWIYKQKVDLSICSKCGAYSPHDKYGIIDDVEDIIDKYKEQTE